MGAAWAVAWAAAGAVAALGVLSVWARVRYARRLTVFRCRVGPPLVRWRRGARWRLGRRRAAWAGDVLLVSTGVLRTFLTPVASGLPLTAAVRPLEPGRARGLGLHPVSVRLSTGAGRSLEIAVPQACAEDLAGPFLAAALPLPRDEAG